MRLELSRRATADLNDIYLFGLQRWGEAQAERYAQDFWRAAKFIAQYPLAARERAEATPPVRVHRLKAHLIAYRVQDDEVLVIRVAHARSDWISGLE